MAVRSAFALLCFALLCGLAASSGFQSKTETELTKNEGEVAGTQVLVEEAAESRVARGSKNKKKDKTEACKKNPKSKKCQRKKTRKSKPKKSKGKGKNEKKNKKRKNRHPNSKESNPKKLAK